MVSGQEFDYLPKIVLIGSSGVGKSSILLRYTDGVFGSSSSTIGASFKVKIQEALSKKVKLTIWDTAGQERFGTLSQIYYRGANSVIIFFDLTDKSSFEALNEWIQQAKQYITDEALIYLVGNKLDLSSQRCVTFEDANNFANKNSIPYFETSAKEGNGIDELFTKIAEDFAKKFVETQSSEPKESLYKGLY